MDINKLTVVGNRVLLKIIKASYKTGVLLDPHAGDRKTPFALVLQQGEGVERRLVGEKVLYSIYEGVRLDTDHLLMEEEFIFAILEDDEVKEGKND